MNENGETKSRWTPQEAQERWGISRAAYYARLKKVKVLGIVPEKEGNSTYLNAEQIQTLDELDEFILDGGSVSDFVKIHTTGSALAESSDSGSDLSQSSDDRVFKEEQFASQDELIQRFDRAGQELAYRGLAQAKERIAGAYLANPDRLDSDLRDRLFATAEDHELVDPDALGKQISQIVLFGDE